MEDFFSAKLAPTPTVSPTPDHLHKFVKEDATKTWVRIGTIIFDHLLQSNANSGNTWVCIPQLVSFMIFISNAANKEPAAVLRKEIVNDKLTCGQVNPTARQVIEVLSGELNTWMEKLKDNARPGNLLMVRRLLVHPNYSKSYEHATFDALNSQFVELKIVSREHNDVAHWLRDRLKAPFITENPFQLWREMEKATTKQDEKGFRKHGKHHLSIRQGGSGGGGIYSRISSGTASTSQKDTGQIHTNQKCPILAWASHFSIAFASDVLDSENSYFRKDVMHCRLRSMKDLIRVSLKNGLEVIEIPCEDPSLLVFVIKDADGKGMKNFNVEETITEAKKCGKPAGTVYLPMWSRNEDNCTNTGRALKMCFDVDALFAHAGFGDLSYQDGTASSEFTSLLTSNIQHFDTVTIKHAPGMDANHEEIPPAESSSTRVITAPYKVVVWDNESSMPVYLASVRKVQTSTRSIEDDSDKENHSKRRCIIM